MLHTHTHTHTHTQRAHTHKYAHTACACAVPELADSWVQNNRRTLPVLHEQSVWPLSEPGEQLSKLTTAVCLPSGYKILIMPIAGFVTGPDQVRTDRSAHCRRGGTTSQYAQTDRPASNMCTRTSAHSGHRQISWESHIA